MSGTPFPAAVRAAALAWLLLFVTAYWRTYGLANFLQLCDVAVILTCWGLWRGSSLLLSSQALSSLVVDVAWDLDFLWRLVWGRHLIGGTEYMWDARYPLAVRALSLFHVVWPALLVWAVRRAGYDRRAWLRPVKRTASPAARAIVSRLAARASARVRSALASAAFSLVVASRSASLMRLVRFSIARATS